VSGGAASSGQTQAPQNDPNFGGQYVTEDHNSGHHATDGGFMSGSHNKKISFNDNPLLRYWKTNETGS
jgi:hypothetical protein